MAMVSLNSLDFLLILLVLIGAAWGALQGVGKLLLDLLSLYVALVVSLLLYLPLAVYLKNLVPAFSVVGSQALAFAFIAFVVSNGLSILARFVTTPVDERRRRRARRDALPGTQEETWRGLLRRLVLGPLSTVIGVVIGLIVATVWLSLVLALLQFVVLSPTTGTGGEGAFAGLKVLLSTSALIPWFNLVLYFLHRALDIWFTGGEVPVVFARPLMLR